MGWMNLDQASFLRELMNKSQRVKTSPFAILSSSDFHQPEDAVLRMVEDFSQQTQRSVTLLGLSKEEKTIEACLENKKSLDDVTERVNQKLLLVSGGLDFISAIREDKDQVKHLSNEIQKLERKSDTLFYVAGQGLTTTSINLSLMTNKVIFFLKNTNKSLLELTNMVKIFSKTNSNQEIGIVLEAENEELFQEQANKIQELYWKQFKYYIEPIGYCHSDVPRDFEAFAYDYVLKKTETKMFSETLEQMFL